MPRKRSKIGPYNLVEEIGAGGMATVFQAVQPELERYVAIKELREESAAHAGVAERFEREARSMAALAHQNIVHIYEFLRKQNSSFIVMEYVDGIDLSSLLARVGQVEPLAAAIIASQVARALEYAHFRGVIHRDLKPSNIMLSTQGETKLMDFGVAKDEAFQDLTRTGQALGTPSYMSPEQIMGQQIDHRSDIFSFGVLFYELLVGQKPFRSQDTMAVVHKILHGGVVKPRQVDPSIPGELQRVVLRCLQKNPGKRPQNASLLRHELECWVARRVPIDQPGYLIDYLEDQSIIEAPSTAAGMAAPDPSQSVAEPSLIRPGWIREPETHPELSTLKIAALYLSAALLFGTLLWLWAPFGENGNAPQGQKLVEDGAEVQTAELP